MTWTRETIAELLDRYCLTQKELAAGIGLSEATITQIMRGATRVNGHAEKITEFYQKIKRKRIQEAAEEARNKISLYEKPFN